jgi:hypothetical protein
MAHSPILRPFHLFSGALTDFQAKNTEAKDKMRYAAIFIEAHEYNFRNAHCTVT